MNQPQSTNTPKVSVIMPAYNHERFVGAAIDSVIGQSYRNLELIIIDDGSTDNTATVIQSYDDPRIRYHYQENQDAYNALNRGLSLATGEFISIINSDDIYPKQRLELLLKHQQQHQLHCIFTNLTPIDENGEIISDQNHPWNQWHKANRDYYLECRDLYAGFLHGNYMVTTSNLFFSTQVYRHVGEFCALRFLHDYDYIFRILFDYEKHTSYLYDDDLLFYRLHGSNTISEAAIVGREQDKEVIRKYLLAKCPDNTHLYLETGINRLIELEHELVQVRQQLSATSSVATSEQQPSLVGRVYRKLHHSLKRT